MASVSEVAFILVSPVSDILNIKRHTYKQLSF